MQPLGHSFSAFYIHANILKNNGLVNNNAEEKKTRMTLYGHMAAYGHNFCAIIRAFLW